MVITRPINIVMYLLILIRCRKSNWLHDGSSPFFTTNMSIKITTCDKCESINITDLNGELRDTSNTLTVKIKAKCNECGHVFEYPTVTKRGKKSSILW